MGQLSERLNGSAKSSSMETITDGSSKICDYASAVDSLVTEEIIAHTIRAKIDTDSALAATLHSLYATARTRLNTVAEGMSDTITMIREIVESGAELPDWTEDLNGAVTMLRTFIEQVPAVIANRVTESVMDIAVAAQLNLAAGVVVLTDNIRSASDSITKQVAELESNKTISISSTDAASEHHRALTYRTSMLQVYAAHDQYRTQADQVTALSVELRRAQTIRNSGDRLSPAARNQLTTVVSNIQSSLDTGNSCKESFHKQIVETAFDLINMAPSERSDKTNPLQKLGSMKLRSGESSPKTASDIRSAVMAYIRMHVPELYGIMFVIIRFLETPVTLESWEPVRNYDISAIESDKDLTDAEFVDKFDALGFQVKQRESETHVMSQMEFIGKWLKDDTTVASPAPAPAEPALGGALGARVASVVSDDLLTASDNCDTIEEQKKRLFKQIAVFTAHNKTLYLALAMAAPDAVKDAVDRSSSMSGDTVHETRQVHAAAYDGISVIETWILDAEKLGSFVKDQAQDMVHHGAGFLLQPDWRRGVQRLRDGIHRARELGVLLTHRRTIFKYFMELETARSDVARQLTADGFHTPPGDPESDCSVRLLNMIAQFQVIMSTKTGDAILIAGDVEDVANLVHFAEMHGRMVLGDDEESANIIFNNRTMPVQQNNKSGGPAHGPLPEFPEGSKSQNGRKCCDVNGCGVKLDDAEEAAWKKEQAGLDKRHTGDGNRRTRWARCSACIVKSRAGSTMIFPDGFKYIVQKAEKAKAEGMIYRGEDLPPRAKFVKKKSTEAGMAAEIAEDAADADGEEEAKSVSVQALEATVASQQAQIDQMYQYAAQYSDMQRGPPNGFSHDVHRPSAHQAQIDVHDHQRRQFQEASTRARAQRESQLQWNAQQNPTRQNSELMVRHDLNARPPEDHGAQFAHQQMRAHQMPPQSSSSRQN